jgi:hypothetical protein
VKYHHHDLEFIQDPEEIASYYGLINQVMQKVPPYPFGGSYKNVLIKQPGWSAVCAHEELRDLSLIFRTIREYGYTELKAVSWDLLEPRVMKVQATDQGMQSFRYERIAWTILFAGNPDWMILFPGPHDFWLMAGKSDIIEKFLECTMEEAFSSVDEMIAESKLLGDKGREYLSYLLHQLREVYPSAQVGDAIDFDF